MIQLKETKLKVPVTKLEIGEEGAKDSVHKHYMRLCLAIYYHRYKFHIDHKAEIPDIAYDDMIQELKDFENLYPGIKNSFSPLTRKGPSWSLSSYPKVVLQIISGNARVVMPQAYIWHRNVHPEKDWREWL